MDDKKIAEILDNEENANKNIEPETPKGEPKTFEVNGRTYTETEMDKMAADFQASEKERGRLAQEVGTQRKTQVPETPANQNQGVIQEKERPFVQKVFKEELGFVTRDELDMRDYVKAASGEIKRLADKYGVDEATLTREFDLDLNRQTPVKELEKAFAYNHWDKYEEKRKADIAANKPATPYTERTVKSGLETGGGSTEPMSFRKNNTIKKAMEVIGANE